MRATTPSLSPLPSLWVTGAIGMLALTTMAAYWIAMPPSGDLPSAVAVRAMPIEVTLPQTVKPASSARADAVIVSQRSGDGLFYLTAGVNGHPVRFVMDTGASVVVLSPADATSAGIEVSGRSANNDVTGGLSPSAASSALPETRVTTASGAVDMHWVRVGAITLGQRTFHDVPVAIAPGGTVSLIGQSLLSRIGTITLRGDRMDIR